MSDRKYIGYCHMCKALSEFSDYRRCPRTRVRRPAAGPQVCEYRISLLWKNHPIAQAVLAAYQLGGWSAAIQVWDSAGRPELAYDDNRPM
jgi:hypothetical protein